MTDTKTQPILYVILTLLVVNLCVSGLVLLRDRRELPSNQASSAHTLPSSLETKEAKSTLFEKIRKAYNAQQDDVLRNMLDPVVREQITDEYFTQQMSSLRTIAGEIQSGAYSHYESIGTTQGMTQFRLYYQVTLETGKGVVEIIVGTQGDEPHRLLGWFVKRTGS